MAELTAKGAEFIGDVRDEGWGITAQLKVLGAGEMTLYQPQLRPARDVGLAPNPGRRHGNVRVWPLVAVVRRCTPAGAG
jgi:hypothetical protein